MKPRGFIFDFDGVVVDSMALHLNAWDQASQKLYGHSVSNPERLSGRSTNAIAAMLANENAAAGTEATLADIKREILQNFGSAVPLLPGVREIFSALDERKIPYGIASNAPSGFIKKTLESLGLKVAVVIGIDNTPRPKPYPDPYLICAKQLNLSIQDQAATVVFEDSRHGIRAAIQAGMIAIGVASQHPQNDLIESGARLVCSHLRDALDRGWIDFLPLN